MGYMHINNLYKDQRVLNFKRVFAAEKIHGSSSHVRWDGEKVEYFSGGAKHESFVEIFNGEELKKAFVDNGHYPLVIYGEVYGGKMQGMKHVYGSELKFVAFDVKSGDVWLDMRHAEIVARKLGFDFVPYEEVECTLENLDRERDRESVQAIKNGTGEGKWREGIVIRPINEMRDGSGERVIAKHKRPEARETKTERQVVDPSKLEVLVNAKKIAEEWVTRTRLQHVLDKLPQGTGIESMKQVIISMTEDIKREGEGEIEWSKDAEKMVGKSTAMLFKKHLEEVMRNEHS